MRGKVPERWQSRIARAPSVSPRGLELPACEMARMVTRQKRFFWWLTVSELRPKVPLLRQALSRLRQPRTPRRATRTARVGSVTGVRMTRSPREMVLPDRRTGQPEIRRPVSPVSRSRTIQRERRTELRPGLASWWRGRAIPRLLLNSLTWFLPLDGAGVTASVPLRGGRAAPCRRNVRFRPICVTSRVVQSVLLPWTLDGHSMMSRRCRKAVRR